MRKIFVYVCLFIPYILFAGNNGSFSFTDMENQNIHIETIESYFFQWFLIDDSYSFQKVSDRTDELGIQHVNYKEYYKGVEVESSLIMVHAKNGIVYSVNGNIMQNNASKKPSMSFLKSTNIDNSNQKIVAIQKNGKTEYHIAEITREGMFDVYRDIQTGNKLKKVPLFRQAGDMQGSAFTIYNGIQNITNYEVDGVYLLVDEQRKIVTVDATYADANSETMGDYIYSCNPFYSGFSLWARPVLTKICIDWSSDWWEAKLTDQKPDFFIKVKDQYGYTLYTSSVKDDTNPPISWNVNIPLDGEKITVELYEEDLLKNDGPISEVCATYRAKEETFYHKWDEGSTHGRLYFSQTSPEFDAHWGMEKTYDYYLNTFNRKSYDGEGSTIYNVLNSSMFDDFNAAAFSVEPYPMFYGNGGTFNGTKFKPFVSLDIMAHEFTHLITERNGNGGLSYDGESGALNESFSDIFGTCVEFYAKGEEANWLIGDGLMSGYTNLRDMSNPKNGMDGDIIYAVAGYPQPDTYGGDYWQDITAGNDNGGVHRNSGVQNYWFYLLCEGGSGTNDNNEHYSVSAIGMNDAQKIAYRNLMTYLTPYATFRDACDGSIQAARDLFGKGSGQEKAVKDAWRAVGVSYTINSAYLSQLILYADSLLQNTQVGTSIGQYGQAEFEALEAENIQSKAVLENDDNTQQVINLQATLLESAITNYLESIIVDKSNLQTLIARADSLLTNTQVGTKPEQYGQKEFLALSNQKEKADEINESESSTQNEIDIECTILSIAIYNYENSKVPTDKTKLISTILRAENLLNNTQVGTELGQYGQAEYLALNSEKKKANTILESENSKQSEIDEEVARLSSVIEVYEKSRVESTAVSEIKQEVSISVKDNTIICNVPFQIIAIGGQNVTSQNGALLSGTYIVVTEQGNQKVIVK